MITGIELMAIAASYLVGCFASGYYWVRWRTGMDVRQLGSGSVGARNVGRVLGPWGFLGTLLADGGKGALTVGMAYGFGVGPDAMVACIVAAVVGHNWPVQLRFGGGKGVATSLGALVAYDPFIVVVLAAVFVPIYVWLRSFTLSGMLAFAVSPLVVFWCGLGNVEVAAISFVALLVLFTHRRNIREEIARLHADRSLKERPGTHDKGAD